MKQSIEDTAANASCGVRLMQARKVAGWSCEDVSSRLKVPTSVVHALEADDWTPLGAAVFVRGQLRSYARLLGVDIEAELSRCELAAVIPPDLVSYSHTPSYQRVFEQVTRRAIYIVLTAAIAVPVWMATRPEHQSAQLAIESLELPTDAVASDRDGRKPAQPVAPRRTALIASMAPMAAAAPALAIEFTGDSWVEVFAADGRSLEQGLLSAGQQRHYAAGEIGRVVLGNAAAVEVTRAGKTVDLTRFSRANVARFTLSSDGSLAPVVN